LEAELAPVFDWLETPAYEAGQVIEQARVEAARIKGRADEAGRELLTAARGRAGSVRSEAASARLAGVEAEVHRTMAAGLSEAERIDRAAAAQMPAWAEELVARILSLPGPGDTRASSGAAPGDSKPERGSVS
jgi:hypothetical protein